jgi:hypothetical protein
MLVGLLFILNVLLINPLLPSIRFRQKRYHIIAEMFILVLILYAVPFKISGDPGFELGNAENIHGSKTTNVQIINKLNKMKLDEQTILLSMRSELPVFLDSKVKHIYGAYKVMPFDDYMYKNKITAVLVTKDLLDDAKYRSDVFFLEFISHPKGFKQIKINADAYLLIKE